MYVQLYQYIVYILLYLFNNVQTGGQFLVSNLIEYNIL